MLITGAAAGAATSVLSSPLSPVNLFVTYPPTPRVIVLINPIKILLIQPPPASASSAILFLFSCCVGH